MLHDAAELEASYGRDTMPTGLLGLNAKLCERYMRFIANRRCGQLGLAPVFAEAENPFPWRRSTRRRSFDGSVAMSVLGA